jgi:prepilin-type N-terminal cleavage/methylation domain-containing protein
VIGENTYVHRRGFSLIELLIALSIFSVLAAIVAVSSARAREKAFNASLAGAARKLALDHVAPNLAEYPQAVRWGGANREKFLNGKINLALKRPGRSNIYNYKNPVTSSERIRVGGNVGTPADAVLITNRKKYRYDQVKTRKALLKRSKGVVVLWMSNADPGVEVYYIDTSGKLSEFHWTS